MPMERSPARPIMENPLLQGNNPEVLGRPSTCLEDQTLNLPQPLQQTMYDTEYLAAASKPQLPQFMKDRPDIWFYLIEAEFKVSRTRSDDVKYNSTLKALDPESLSQTTDIIATPPEANKYEILKNTIIKRVAASRQK